MLTAEAIAAAGAGWLGDRISVVEEAVSTNADLVAAARAGAPAGTVRVADSQSGGRGRLGRAWHSPPGKNVYLSVLLRPSAGLSLFPPFALVAGVAVAEAVEALAGLEARVKWPNDVLVGGRKLAGVLTEAVDTTPPALVVGVGLNVLEERFPEGLRREATSLALETGEALDRSAAAAAVLRSLAARVDQVEAGDLAAVLDAWTRRSWTIGRRTRVGDVEGIATAIGEDGALLLRGDDGEIRRAVGGTPLDLGAAEV